MKSTFSLLILVIGLAACKSGESLAPLPATDYANPPETVTVKITGYSPQAGNTFQNLFVSNYSVSVKSGSLFYATARDMADTVKGALNATFGFTIISPESVVEGFADLMLFQAGVMIPAQTDLACGSGLQLSSSNDALVYNDDRNGGAVTFLGLRDCAKVYMGLNPSKFNYNGDGIPDYLQMRCGMNPLDKNQAFVSTAGDGVADIDKCKRHVPIDENYYTEANQLYAYDYNAAVNPDSTTDFTVGNIPILNDGQENFIAFYVTEVNTGTNTPSLYTAYVVLPAGSTGKTLIFPYWATAPANFYNQEIVPQ